MPKITLLKPCDLLINLSENLMGNLSAEQTFEVLWSSDTDKFGFRMTLRQRSGTRRDIIPNIRSAFNSFSTSKRPDEPTVV